MTSSAQDFREHNGRRYHAFDDEAYSLPNDELEAARLDLQHHIWKLTLDGRFGRVPITDTMSNVLDVGTGTGIWAMELADAYPHLRVIGTDLSPIQPGFVPPNCEFIIDNAEADFAFDIQFDYIHARMLTMGIHDWERFFRQCFATLVPGGWLESQETVLPARAAEGEALGKTPFLEWSQHVWEAAQTLGVNTLASEGFEEILRRVGFVNIERVNVQWPLTPWAKGKKNKILGKLLWENAQNGVPAVSNLLFARQLGWSKEQVDESCRKALDDCKQGHYYTPM